MLTKFVLCSNTDSNYKEEEMNLQKFYGLKLPPVCHNSNIYTSNWMVFPNCQFIAGGKKISTPILINMNHIQITLKEFCRVHKITNKRNHIQITLKEFHRVHKITNIGFLAIVRLLLRLWIASSIGKPQDNPDTIS